MNSHEKETNLVFGSRGDPPPSSFRPVPEVARLAPPRRRTIRAFRSVQEDPARATTNDTPASSRVAKIAAARVFLRRKPRLPTQRVASVDVGDTRDKATSRTRARCASALPERSPRRYAYPARPSRRSTATREARLRTSGWREPASRRFLTSGPRPLARRKARRDARRNARGRLGTSRTASCLLPRSSRPTRRSARPSRPPRRASTRPRTRTRKTRLSRKLREVSAPRKPRRRSRPARRACPPSRASLRSPLCQRVNSKSTRLARSRPRRQPVRAARARGAGRAVPRAAQTGRASRNRPTLARRLRVNRTPEIPARGAPRVAGTNVIRGVGSALSALAVNIARPGG